MQWVTRDKMNIESRYLPSDSNANPMCSQFLSQRNQTVVPQIALETTIHLLLEAMMGCRANDIAPCCFHGPVVAMLALSVSSGRSKASVHSMTKLMQPLVDID